MHQCCFKKKKSRT